MNEQHYGVVVGINRYPGLPSSLRFARGDADAFRKWLIDPDGGSVPKANVLQVVAAKRAESKFTDPADARPTQAQVFGALRDVNARAKTKIADDPNEWLRSRLYLYVSGHGI